MGLRIGIPRALLYYDYFLLWSTFLEGLGLEIVLSPKTDWEIVKGGIKAAVAAGEETCLPVKVFWGHIRNLASQKVDYLFIPRYLSSEPHRFLCPKFSGLPCMLRQLMPEIPPVLNVNLDLRKPKGALPEEMYRLGKLFTFNSWKIRLAYRLARENQKSFRNKMLQGVLPEEIFFNRTEKGEALKGRLLSTSDRSVSSRKILRVGLIGHGYNLYDGYANMNIIKKLQELGAEVITSKMCSEAEIKIGLQKTQRNIFWGFGQEIIGSAFYLLEERAVNGIILLLSFACAPDATITEIVERAYQRAGTPCLRLMLDEYSTGGVIITRVKEFMEMLKRKNESCASVHGHPVDCP